MTRIDSTKVLWRVQVRKSRAHKWQNKGLFETRQAARNEQYRLRAGGYFDAGYCHTLSYGPGNIRVVRHISGKGKA